MKNRRDFLRNTVGLGAGLAAAPHMFATPQPSGTDMDMKRSALQKEASRDDQPPRGFFIF
jgi:hypothetical protein